MKIEKDKNKLTKSGSKHDRRNPQTPKNDKIGADGSDAHSISYESKTFDTMSTPKTQKKKNMESLETSGMKDKFASPTSLISLKTDSTLSPPRDYQIFSLEILSAFI